MRVLDCAVTTSFTMTCKEQTVEANKHNHNCQIVNRISNWMIQSWVVTNNWKNLYTINALNYSTKNLKSSIKLVLTVSLNSYSQYKSRAKTRTTKWRWLFPVVVVSLLRGKDTASSLLLNRRVASHKYLTCKVHTSSQNILINNVIFVRL